MPKFRCARTKCEAIITNVIAPYAQRLVDDEMTEVSYVTVLTDASNKGSTKMFPVLVRYFVPTEGVRIKIADFCTTKGETSEIISELIKTTAKNRNFAEKVVAFCADNCPTNFGSKQRGGQNNVFFRLKLWIPALLGIGCAAHITHSALKSACDELPIDIELVVVKIYSHFYIYTVRVEKLKNICEMEGVEYKKLLGYAKTRFLALGPAIARILELFDPLKTYFLKVKGETFLKKFFNDSMSKLWLVFVKEQAEAFKETVLSIEGENICAPDVAFQLEQLRASIILRKDENYFSPTMESEIQALHDSGEFSEKSFNAASSCFYDAASDYLLEWTDQFEDLRTLLWIGLRATPTWPNLNASMKFVSLRDKTFDVDVVSPKLFVQFGFLKNYCSGEKISEWDKQGTPTEDRWVEVFRMMMADKIPFVELGKIVQFILCLPGTSAAVERIFSLINNLWKSESSNLHVNTLRAILLVKCNLTFSCTEFHKLLKSDKDLIQQVSGHEKYAFKASSKSETN
uniref:(northern house mosquito) hypothetical protein n=2 Tax=Culex pipiens TaxID=7175 RepID=A0A8D8JTE7_CULPI